jgi:hypothetical protein
MRVFEGPDEMKDCGLSGDAPKSVADSLRKSGTAGPSLGRFYPGMRCFLGSGGPLVTILAADATYAHIVSEVGGERQVLLSELIPAGGYINPARTDREVAAQIARGPMARAENAAQLRKNFEDSGLDALLPRAPFAAEPQQSLSKIAKPKVGVTVTYGGKSAIVAEVGKSTIGLRFGSNSSDTVWVPTSALEGYSNFGKAADLDEGFDAVEIVAKMVNQSSATPQKKAAAREWLDLARKTAAFAAAL